MIEPHRPRLVDIQGRPFELVGTLSRGSFGDVYLAALQPPIGPAEQVSLKLLSRGLDPDPDTMSVLRDEAARLEGLDHPFVLAPREITEIEGRVALVAPYFEGAELGACLVGESRLPRSAMIEVIEQVASALHAVWTGLEIVHRDVKPPNIRIGVLGETRLVDFGVARRTKADVLVGTIAYVAPERFDPERPVEPPSDVFSLGCVLFEGFVGRRFFHQISTSDMLELAGDEDAYASYLAQRLGAMRPGPAADLVSAMLAHDPAARPSAAEVAWTCSTIATKWPDAVTLRQWCQDRRWPRPAPAPDDAAIRAPVISTVAPAPVRGPRVPRAARVLPPPPEPEVQPNPRWARRSIVAAALGAIGVTLAAASLVFLLLGLYWRQVELDALDAAQTNPAVSPR